MLVTEFLCNNLTLITGVFFRTLFYGAPGVMPPQKYDLVGHITLKHEQTPQ